MESTATTESAAPAALANLPPASPGDAAIASSDGLIHHYRSALRLLAATVESAGGGGPSDIERVMSLCASVAERLGLSEEQVELTRETARFRDLGKADVPISILTKPSALAGTEWEEIREHPPAGERLLAALPGSDELAGAVRHVHERWDGRGYPDRLAGEQIPIASRITHCCTAFDVMRRNRPHRPAFDFATAKAHIEAGSGSRFDPRAVEALFAVLDERADQFDPTLGERFLIVEDSRSQSEFFRRVLLDYFPGRGVDQAQTATAAIGFLAAMPACAGIICDLDLEGPGDSRRVIREARRRHGPVPIVAISARMSDRRRAEVLGWGADAALSKGPQTLAELPRRLGALSGVQLLD